MKHIPRPLFAFLLGVVALGSPFIVDITSENLSKKRGQLLIDKAVLECRSGILVDAINGATPAERHETIDGCLEDLGKLNEWTSADQQRWLRDERAKLDTVVPMMPLVGEIPPVGYHSDPVLIGWLTLRDIETRDERDYYKALEQQRQKTNIQEFVEQQPTGCDALYGLGNSAAIAIANANQETYDTLKAAATAGCPEYLDYFGRG